ncbi:SapC family protein [Chromohalobacter japonicus]|uniref:SapC family protein n=1 Tax=Chromohalobacter japonicus TaxID=223900 RepID=UPI003F8F9899
MPRYIPLSQRQHAERGWLKNPDYRYAAERPVAELVAEEIPRALPTLPLAFVPEGDDWALVAVLSLDSKHNLFVHPDGRWLGGYTPAAFRGYPFALLRDEQHGRRVLCFDEDSGLATDNPGPGQHFFNNEGEPDQPLARILKFLTQYDDQRLVTRRVVKRLADAGLIVPWKVRVTTDAGTEAAIDGLHRIDEAALRALPGDTLSELATSGALSIAYGQLYAQHRLQGLSRLVDLQARIAEQQNPSAEHVDVEALFGDDDDLTFNFDD